MGGRARQALMGKRLQIQIYLLDDDVAKKKSKETKRPCITCLERDQSVGTGGLGTKAERAKGAN